MLIFLQNDSVMFSFLLFIDTVTYDIGYYYFLCLANGKLGLREVKTVTPDHTAKKLSRLNWARSL